MGRSIPRPAHRRTSGLFEGWLGNAMDIALAPLARPAASSSASATRSRRSSTARSAPGRSTNPDVVVEATPTAIYDMFVERRLDQVRVEGDRALLAQLVDAAPPRVEIPAPV